MKTKDKELIHKIMEYKPTVEEILEHMTTSAKNEKYEQFLKGKQIKACCVVLEQFPNKSVIELARLADMLILNIYGFKN